MSKLHLLLVCCLSVATMQGLQAQTGGTMDAIDLESILGNSIRARHIGPGITSGRVSDLEGHPTNSRILYVGTAGGGVWKSTSGGSTFNPIFEEHSQGIGVVRLDPSDPDNTIWVGTGECWVRNSVSVGDGIYLSKDGGKNWEHKGLENSERISSILINPDNPNEITVGVLGALWGDSEDRGIYRSTDGGTTWERIFYINEQTGCADLIMDPRDPNTMFASFWEFRRTAWSFSSGGENSALYKTTDGGKTWAKAHGDFPKGKLGRIAVAIAPSQPDIMYAVLETETEEDKGLYRSENGGDSWAQVNNDFELVVRPFYFSRIVVDPKDPERLVKAGLMGSMSEDGGKTFTATPGGVHPDIHDYWFDQNVEDRIFMGTDGGVFFTWDQGESWNMVGDLPVAQFYHVTIDNEEPFNVYGGLQDNGSWRGHSSNAGGITGKDWTGVGYGDGFRVYPHPDNPDIIYSEMQGAEQVWRVHIPTGQAQIIKPWPEGDEELRFNWNAPITTSPHQVDRLYIGSQFVHRSEDMGKSWKKISGDLTTNDPSKLNQAESGGLSKDNSGAENHCTIFTISESPLDQNVIWAGTDDGNIQVTTDGGNNWSSVTGNISGLPANTWVYHIDPSPHDRLTAFASFDGHTQNDSKTYAYKTTDGGMTWTSIINGDVKGFTRSILQDVINPELIYLGTEFGLYLTINGGKTWAKFTNNMPPVAIHHMTQDPKTGSLVIATHGRGIIIIDNLFALQQMTADVLDKDVFFFKAPPTIRKETTMFAGSDGNYQSEYGDQFIGQSASNGMQIYYYFKKRHVFGKMSMEVLDTDGNKIMTLTPTKSKGLNKVQWGYQHPLPKVAKGASLAFGGFTAPMVAPGTYVIRLTKKGEVFEQRVELLPDPNSIYSIEEQRESHMTIMTLYNMNEELADLVEQVDSVDAQLIEYSELNVSSKLTKLITASTASLNEMKQTMVVTDGDNYVGRSENQLREDISDLYSQVASYSGPPSNAQLTRLKYLENTLSETQSSWKTFKENLDKELKKKLPKG